MKNFLEFCGDLIALLLLMAAFAALQGVIVMLLWNWLVPKIFGLCTISFIEGWGLSFLCSVLFSGVSVSKHEKD